MKTINPKEVSIGEFHSYLVGAVAPRPIAFASTIDKKGNVNLSPFSFFNTFGANPPILIFSPANRVRDNTLKHSFENVREVREVVINIVNYAIVEQMSLASTEYDKGINEFIKSGLTPAPSEMVRPPRVAESPASFECKVINIIETGKEGGAGNLIICEIVLAHIDENILNENGKIDPYKLDAIARMGGNFYCRANGEALFEIPKPLRTKGIGIDQLPEHIRNSAILTGNHLGRLGNVERIPDAKAVEHFSQGPELQEILQRFKNDKESLDDHLHLLAKKYLEEGKIEEAWLTLLQA